MNAPTNRYRIRDWVSSILDTIVRAGMFESLRWQGYIVVDQARREGLHRR